MEPIEAEFDPAEFSAEFIAVEQSETLSSILDRVVSALKRTPNVVLIVPRGSQAFHTTQDFLALGKLQWTGEVRVAVASPDPTIAGLARVLGFHIVDTPQGHPSIADDPSLDQSDAPGGEPEQPTAPLPLGNLPEWVIASSVPVYTPSNSPTTSTWLNMPGDTAQKAEPPKPATRSGMPPPRTKPRQTGVLLSTNIADAPPLTPVIDPEKVDDPKTPDGDAMARRALIDGKAYRNGRRWRYNSGARTMRWGRLFTALSVLLIVALIAGSAYAYVYLPEGTVQVKPLDRSIQGLPIEIVVLTAPQQGGSTTPVTSSPASMTDGVATLSATPITALKIEAPLMSEDTAPATGTRQIAKGQAAGTMHFANQTSLSKSVPAGTQFKAPNGVILETTQGVTVPPTNLLAGTVGRANAPLIATVDGPDGNIAEGQLYGVYGGALEYVNSALTGGSLQTLKVVTQADIDGLIARLTAQVEGQVAGAIAVQVQQGQQLIPRTTTFTAVPSESDHNAGEDAEAVHVKVSGTARAFVFSEDKVEEAITQTMVHWVATNLDEYASLNIWGNITHDALTLQSVNNENGQAIYSTNASALVKYTLTPELAQKIRDLVKGQDVSKAQELLQQNYKGVFSTQLIQARVLWFNIGKLPSDPAHIVVELGSSASVAPDMGSAQSAPQQNARPSQR